MNKKENDQKNSESTFTNLNLFFFLSPYYRVLSFALLYTTFKDQIGFLLQAPFFYSHRTKFKLKREI